MAVVYMATPSMIDNERNDYGRNKLFRCLLLPGKACAHTPRPTSETADEIIAAMGHFGIHEALVVDVLSREVNPMAGNKRILHRTKDCPRLHPAWAGLMSHSREILWCR